MSARPTTEVDAFAESVHAYLGGTMPPDDFKKCRLQLGIYGIRGLTNKQMVRIKVPSGRLSADQADRVAELAEQLATGRIHVTTRQDLQLYEVPVERTPELLGRLDEVGLTTREACGNSVRNVTACPFAGLCAEELFDVTPYALAVTRHFLRNPLSQSLPRKFKISFSGCSHDCAAGMIHDIGAVATSGHNGHRGLGFTLYVGGGLGAVPRAAHALEPFTPVEQLLPTCEAIIRVFDAHGERKNRQRARMKFLIERIGFEAFQHLAFEARRAVLAQPGRFPTLPPPAAAVKTSTGPGALPDTGPGHALYRRWLATNVQPQRQAGVAVVTIRLVLGDLTVAQTREVSALARRASQGRLITTQWQDICLPWVAFEELPSVFQALTRMQLARPEAQRIQDITSCPGADTCQIGVTSSRGLARALTDVLERPEYLTEDLKDVRIKISGCPNSCGLHHIADIGFFGAARTIGGKLVPHYQLLLAGHTEQGQVAFGQPVVKLPAKHVPRAVETLLAFYRRRRQDGESFRAFVSRTGVAAFETLLSGLTALGPAVEEPEAYRDWGHTTDFSLTGMGQGECAGG